MGHSSHSDQLARKTGASFPRNLGFVPRTGKHGFRADDNRVRIEGCYQNAEWIHTCHI